VVLTEPLDQYFRPGEPKPLANLTRSGSWGIRSSAEVDELERRLMFCKEPNGSGLLSITCPEITLEFRLAAVMGVAGYTPNTYPSHSSAKYFSGWSVWAEAATIEMPRPIGH